MLSAQRDRTGSQLASQRPITDSVVGGSHGLLVIPKWLYLESLMRAGQLTMKQFDDALASTMGASGNYPTPGRSDNGRVNDSRRPANARIPAGDLRTMAAAMPDCRFVVMPTIGHSMNLELPAPAISGPRSGVLPK